MKVEKEANLRLPPSLRLSLPRAFVDKKYRLEIRPPGYRRGWKDRMKAVRVFMDAEDEGEDDDTGGTALQGSDIIRNLQLLEFSVSPAYLLACYSSLAERRTTGTHGCECLPAEMIMNSHTSFREREKLKLRHCWI